MVAPVFSVPDDQLTVELGPNVDSESSPKVEFRVITAVPCSSIEFAPATALTLTVNPEGITTSWVPKGAIPSDQLDAVFQSPELTIVLVWADTLITHSSPKIKKNSFFIRDVI